MRQRQKRRGPTAAKVSTNVQTTLRLPAPLYERAKDLVKCGSSRSVNDFIVSALAAYVRAKERRAVDEAFRPMRDDLAYQREALMIAEQFASSDLETIKISERDLVDA
jgi:propanediol dehydratase small subunit